MNTTALMNHQIRLAARPVGSLKSKEDIVQGLDTFPQSLLMLFEGKNFGKLVLQVAPE